MNEIKSFRPFLAQYVDYEGSLCIIRFTCERCGSHNVRPRMDLNFFQGHFFCGYCGYSMCDDGHPYFYASRCFSRIFEENVKQLTLF